MPPSLSTRGQDSTCYSPLLLVYLIKKGKIQFTKPLQVISTCRKKHVIFSQRMFHVKVLQILYVNPSLLWSAFIPNKNIRNALLLKDFKMSMGLIQLPALVRYFFCGSPPLYFHSSSSCSCSDSHLPRQLE